MINIVDAIKELFIVKKAVQAVQAAPKTGYLTTEWLGVFLMGLSSVYMGLHSLIPPLYSLYFGVSLSVIWLIFRQILKMKHLSLAPVQGIPELDVDGLVNLLTKKFPTLAPASDEIKTATQTVITEIKAEPVAPAVTAEAAKNS